MSASHGQRFRRRAIRRGYKVDEVDVFLDRVEATLNGNPMGPPVRAQEVHDVVFRVRFGGYDEWQVDLHLDRVERQLADIEERQSAPVGVGAQLRAAMVSPMDRGGPPPMPLPTRVPAATVPSGAFAGRYDDRPPFDQPPPPPLPRRDEYATGSFAGLAAQFDRPGNPQSPVDSPSGSFPGFGPPPPGRAEPPRQEPMRGEPMRPEPMRGEPMRPDSMRGEPMRPEPMRGEPMRPDMTGEIRPPRNEPFGSGSYRQVSAPPYRTQARGYDSGSFSTVRDSGSFSTVRPPAAQVPPPSSYGPPAGVESQRVDQLRRTFQLRRFGSGYDPGQVDRLFDNVLGALSGRGGVNEGELDPTRLNLVPGGYYEAEVDQAIREVREILRTR